MSQRVFGTGNLVLVPAGAAPTPIVVGVLQDISYDEKSTIKKLYGSKRVMIDAGAGETTHGGKIKSAVLNGPLIQALSYGATSVAGTQFGVANESATIPGTPFQVTSAHAATWLSDLGVYDITAAKFLARVASAPATGQYSVAAGVYTFASADTGHLVALNYDYTQASTGTTVTLTNQPMGSLNFFGMKLYNNFTDSSGVSNSGIYFPRMFISDQSLAFKNTDFVAHDVTWEAMEDNAGNVRYLYTGN